MKLYESWRGCPTRISAPTPNTTAGRSTEPPAKPPLLITGVDSFQVAFRSGQSGPVGANTCAQQTGCGKGSISSDAATLVRVQPLLGTFLHGWHVKRDLARLCRNTPAPVHSRIRVISSTVQPLSRFNFQPARYVDPGIYPEGGFRHTAGWRFPIEL